jgi:hypothetical protein
MLFRSGHSEPSGSGSKLITVMEAKVVEGMEEVGAMGAMGAMGVMEVVAVVC